MSAPNNILPDRMKVDSTLANEYIYVQTLHCPKGETIAKFADDVKAYVENALNDPKRKIGVVFYKAFINTSDNQRQFVVHLFPFSRAYITEQVMSDLRSTYLVSITGKGLKLQSEVFLQRTTEHKRKPRYHGDDDEVDGGEEQSCSNIPGNNFCQKFINWWLIVPRVQWDFFDLLYQMYTFDITHQGFLPKFVHFFTIPTNVMLSMFFLAQFPFFTVDRYGYGAFELNASVALLIVISLLYLIMGAVRKTWTWGIATTVVVCVCCMTGNLWYTVYKTPGNPWYNPTTIATNPLMWSYIISFIQACSHMLVPQLPPYITGVSHWESLFTFFCKEYETSSNKCRSACFTLMALVFFPVLSVGVAWFSWPHLIGTEIIFIMAGVGYQHSAFEKYFRVVEKAVLSGNPGLDDFPRSARELTNDAKPMVDKLKSYGLVSQNPSTAEVVKCVATAKLACTYFKHGLKPRTQEDLHHLKLVREGLHLT